MKTQIAVGVIYNETRDRVLLALRPQSVPQGGLWEFPGGKIKPGEDVEQALVRELDEELGLHVISSTPLITIDHEYPDISVTLHVRTVTAWSGTVTGREGQYIEWVPLQLLPGKDFPDANLPIVAAARLPSLYLITPDLPVYDRVFLDDLEGLLRAGVRLLQFRCKSRGLCDNEAVLGDIVDICRNHGCLCILNGAPADAVRHDCDGVHLSSESLLMLDERPLPRALWVAASCHNREQLNHARSIGVDFVVLGPVQGTRSHPGAEPMGWGNFASLVRCSTIPVFALGGMTGSELQTARINGAQGIAMISGVWEAPNKVQAVKRILER